MSQFRCEWENDSKPRRGHARNAISNRRRPEHCADIARLLDLMVIPYTGAAPTAIELTTDKSLTHQVLRANGVPVPRHVVASSIDSVALNGLASPVIAKLKSSDGSHGIDDESVVLSVVGLEAKAHHLFDHYREPLIFEEFLPGREFSISLLGNSPAVEALPIREIDYSTLPSDRGPTSVPTMQSG